MSVTVVLDSSLSADNSSEAYVHDSSITSSNTMAMIESVLFILGTLLCIVLTVVGNILVILSVFTYRPLRCVQNFFIVSLACADILVAVCVMPFNIANYVIGHWIFGAIVCNMWLTFDILMCTASILNLCAIAIDRYYAIHDPINYAHKRTIKRVLVLISVVWCLSIVISVPPLLGWNNSSGRNLYNSHTMVCELTDQKSFVVYSASGSFFIPLFIMTFVYIKIFLATRRRLRKRAQAAAFAKSGGTKETVITSKKKVNSVKGPSEPSSEDTPEQTSCVNDTKEDKNTDPLLPAGNLLTAPQTHVRNGKPHKHQPTETQRNRSHDTVINKTQNGSDQVPPPSSYSASPLSIPLTSTQPPSSRNASLKSCHSYQSRNSSLKDSPQKKGVKADKDRVLSGGSCGSQQVQKFMEEKQRISLSKERRAARTMSIIMGVFVLCWLPFFLMYIIFPFCGGCSRDVPSAVVNFIIWLGYINSALNPVIYTVFNLDFRRAFKRLLQCKCNYRR